MKYPAIMVDLDGTLASCSWRFPLLRGSWDWDAYHRASERDAPVPAVRAVVNLYGTGPWLIIIVTMRPPAYEEMTQRWLELHDINYDQLVMGPDPEQWSITSRNGIWTVKDRASGKALAYGTSRHKATHRIREGPLDRLRATYDLKIIIDDDSPVLGEWAGRRRKIPVLRVSDPGLAPEPA